MQSPTIFDELTVRLSPYAFTMAATAIISTVEIRRRFNGHIRNTHRWPFVKARSYTSVCWVSPLFLAAPIWPFSAGLSLSLGDHRMSSLVLLQLNLTENRTSTSTSWTCTGWHLIDAFASTTIADCIMIFIKFIVTHNDDKRTIWSVCLVPG